MRVLMPTTRTAASWVLQALRRSGSESEAAWCLIVFFHFTFREQTTSRAARPEGRLREGCRPIKNSEEDRTDSWRSFRVALKESKKKKEGKKDGPEYDVGQGSELETVKQARREPADVGAGSRLGTFQD